MVGQTESNEYPRGAIAMLQGLAVFPCAVDKSPLTPHGFKDARRNANTTGWPRVGIATGAINQSDVIDIDPAGVGWHSANFDALPQTRAQQTPRGLHLYFVHTPGLRGSVGVISPGVDCRADGNYVIDWNREGYPFEDWPICEMPGWLVEAAFEAMKSKGSHNGGPARLPADHGDGDGMLCGLDPLDYQNHDAWFALMVECKGNGVGREAFIDWSTSDPAYANDAEVIGRRWDSLRIGDWGRRVDARLAELIDARHYPLPTIRGRPCQVPIGGNATVKAKYRFQHRVDALLREVRTGREDLLFWAACVMREIIAEGLIKPDVAVKLLEGAWRGDRGQCRRSIAAAFLRVEDKLTSKGGCDGEERQKLSSKGIGS
jgi:hypothetical protein